MNKKAWLWSLWVGSGALFSLSIHGAVAPETESALESEPQDWVDILPTEQLTSWFRVPVPFNSRLGRPQWHVDPEKKLLICDGDGGHDMLLFDRELGNVIFHVEFCYTKIEGKQGYNSGA